ncbi:MAG TPA: FAD-binding oxidoreductase, partial [Solirubrobacteraceae bacterium]
YRLEQMGWTPHLSISDSRRLVNYYRVTQDGRVVFGKGGGTLALGGRVGPSYSGPSPRVLEVQNNLRHIYPELWDVGIEASWRGPVDYSLTGLPFFCRIAGRDDIVAGVGFSGNGVGPSHLAGRTLATLALEGRDDSIPEALKSTPSGRLPPEPFRYLGGLAVRAATARKEANEDLGRRTGPVTAMIARLDPTSFVDRGPRSNGPDGAGAAKDDAPGALNVQPGGNGSTSSENRPGEEPARPTSSAAR